MTSAGGGRASRRRFLTAAAALGVGVAAGRLTGDGVRVLAPASLGAAVEERLGPAFADRADAHVEAAYHGSATIERLVAAGDRRPDVAMGADAASFRERLYPDSVPWDVAFAANEVGLAYAPDTALGGRLAAGDPWYEVLADAPPGSVVVGDPETQPIGYRAVHLFELAERRYDLAGFRESMLERVDRRGADEGLLAGVEVGTHACAVVYRNMAVDRGLPFRELHRSLNFADVEAADRYGEAVYVTPDGRRIAGRPALYVAAVPDGARNPEAGRAFVSFLLERPDLLEACGLRVGDGLPRANGPVPASVTGDVGEGAR